MPKDEQIGFQDLQDKARFEKFRLYLEAELFVLHIGFHWALYGKPRKRNYLAKNSNKIADTYHTNGQKIEKYEIAKKKNNIVP